MGKVETYGGELSTVMRPTDNDTINLSVAYLNASVAESQVVLVHSSGLEMDVNGATMPNSPERQVNLSYERKFDFEPGSLFLRGDGRYSSDYYLENFNYLSSGMSMPISYPDGSTRTHLTRDIWTAESHTVFDFTATFLIRDGGYTVSAYVKNITEEYWKIRSDGIKFNTITAPRTYGVTFTARF